MEWNHTRLQTGRPEPKGIKVPPLSIAQIRRVADTAREFFGIVNPYVDVIKLYEVTLAGLGVVYDWCTEQEMQGDHGLTFPNHGVIKIREDVYLGAHDGNGRDRFTMIHEVGHLVQHDNVAFSRATTKHQFYEDSEWQADTFAAELMMPREHVRQLCKSPIDVMDAFGVSRSAANKRWSNLQKRGFIG